MPITIAALRSLVGHLRPLAVLAGALTVAMATMTTPAPAAAQAQSQEAVTSFEELSSHVAVGDRLWVTDSGGHVTRGRLEQLTRSNLTLNVNGAKLFDAGDVSLIRHRQRDSVKNGALIGLGVGGGMGTVWCIAALMDDSGDVDAKVECPEGLIFAGLGTLIGVAVDALIPGKPSVVYRSTAAPAPPDARRSISVVPVIGEHRFMLIAVVRR